MMARKIAALVLVFFAAAGCVCGLLLLFGGSFLEKGKLGAITTGAVITLVSFRPGSYFWHLRHARALPSLTQLRELETRTDP